MNALIDYLILQEKVFLMVFSPCSYNELVRDRDLKNIN